MTEPWRLFIALDLPEPIRSHLAQVQSTLKAHVPAGAVRWQNVQKAHLTLKFLGNVHQKQIPDVEKRLAEACAGHSPFTLATAELGCFPSMSRPRVVWAGVGGDVQALQALRDAVEGAIAPLGFPTEDPRFQPHLTLGRVRPEVSAQDSRAVGHVIADHNRPDSVAWTVTDVILYRSELEPGGSRYTPLYHVALTTT